MRRRLPLLAEVVLGFHDAAPEVMLPDAVHHHAGGERMVGAGQPARERQAVAASFALRARRADRIGLSGRTDDLQEPRLDRRPGTPDFAALQQANLGRRASAAPPNGARLSWQRRWSP